MRAHAWLLIPLSLSLSGAAAQAAGISLTWTNCLADGGVRNFTFACASNLGTRSMVGTFVLDAPLTSVSGLSAIVDVGTDAETLPAWWSLKEAGSCRPQSLSITAHNGASCPDWAVLQASMSIPSYQVGVHGPNTARINVINAVVLSAVQDLVAGQEYGAFRINIASQLTTGAGACAGCSVPACMSLVSITIHQLNGNSVTLTDAAYAPESKYVGWQTDIMSNPPPNPICAELDSGGFAVNTTVVGRGNVLRSRTKPRYVAGSPLDLTAVPLAGDRFVAWSGDTTTTEATLSIVVNRELNYFATFERDPAAAATLVSVNDVPNDQGAHVLATWNRSPIDDAAYPGILCCYRVERTLNASQAAPWVAASASIPANHSSSYSQDVTTPADSVQGDPAQLRYRIITIAAGTFGEWISNEAVGYSVDNIAPPPLPSVSGVMASGVATMFWSAGSAPDVAHYAIYRGLESEPPVDDAHRVGTTTTTNYADSPGFFANYRVTVVDRHGNESVGTPFVALNSVAVEDKASPRTLTVGHPSPSPMRRTMTLSLGLPRSMSAKVDVLDSQGRLVRRLFEGEQSAGWATISWDARDHRGQDARPGMYFVRVHTPDGITTRRLALIP